MNEVKVKKKGGCLKIIGIIILILIVMGIIGNLMGSNKKESKQDPKQQQQQTEQKKEEPKQENKVDEATEIKQNVVPLYEKAFGDYLNVEYLADTNEIKLQPKAQLANELRVYNSNPTEQAKKNLEEMINKFKESSRIITKKGYKDITVELINPDDPSKSLVKIVNGEVTYNYFK